MCKLFEQGGTGRTVCPYCFYQLPSLSRIVAYTPSDVRFPADDSRLAGTEEWGTEAQLYEHAPTVSVQMAAVTGPYGIIRATPQGLGLLGPMDFPPPSVE